MFINVVYKDAPELSVNARRDSAESDASVEKNLLVNPNCPVRIMLEYIRKQCKLGSFTMFDLCDESGALLGLFNMETYAYATDKFEHKRTYYIVVVISAVQGTEHKLTVLLQLNQENRLYPELKQRVMMFLVTNNSSATMSKKSSPSLKISPPKTPSKSTGKSSKAKKK